VTKSLRHEKNFLPLNL